MVKILNFIFGGVLVLLGLNSLFGIFGDPAYMFFIVGGIGVIILLTPVMRGSSNPFYYFVKRWIFGGFLVLSSISSFLGGMVPGLDYISYGTITAGLITILIGTIYFLSVIERTKNINLSVE